VADVTIAGAVKRFGALTAVRGVDLSVRSGEFLALLGPSGCGKTTLLRLIAGFETLDEGAISIDGETVSARGLHVPTERRRIGMVFQSYALWPHMTVAENVAFALRLRRLSRAEIEGKVVDALDTVGLGGLGERRPSQLSGGQRQRVALARCLAMRPGVVLLDEPLANLDAHLRDTMQEEFRAFHKRGGATMIYVTHDQSEALALADRVAVMFDGIPCQVDSPRALYDRPAGAEVARFIGKGSVVPIEVESARDGVAAARLAGFPLTFRCASGQRPGPAGASIRPEAAVVARAGSSVAHALTAWVRTTRFSGARHEVTLVLPGDDAPVLRAVAAPDHAPEEGAEVRVSINDGWVIAAT